MIFIVLLLILGSSSSYRLILKDNELNFNPIKKQFPADFNFLHEVPEAFKFENEQLQFFEDELRIPGETPKNNDTYLCSAYRYDTQNFIVGFDPLVDKQHIHHVILFGCDAPGVIQPVPAWNCGEMSNGGDQQYLQAPPCAGQPNIIYAWAKGAPKLDLPEGVAFPVGLVSRSRYLVVQVHYMHGMEMEDFSGVKIRYTHTPQSRTAATLLMVTGGEIKPHSNESFEAACFMDEPVQLHPFAFRVHTHKHGNDVSGWVVKEDPISQKNSWHLIGRRDPQKEQLFETVANKSLVINEGDVVASRCRMANDDDQLLKMGPSGADEMCNFYMMYWVEGTRTPQDNTCFSPGAPTYFWWMETGLNNPPK